MIIIKIDNNDRNIYKKSFIKIDKDAKITIIQSLLSLHTLLSSKKLIKDALYVPADNYKKLVLVTTDENIVSLDQINFYFKKV